MKAKIFQVMDSETIGLQPRNFIYDLAYVIATRSEIICERTFLIKEIITDPMKMKTAYFSGRVFTHYIPQLSMGRIKIFPWSDVVTQFRNDFEEYEVDCLVAYNAPFDLGAMKRTNALLAQGEKILPHKPELIDLYTWACIELFNCTLYHDVAEMQGWKTTHGNVLTTAEKAYAFSTGDLDFVESHTALEDSRIEYKVLQKLLSRHGIVPYGRMDGAPWRHAQTVKGELI